MKTSILFVIVAALLYSCQSDKDKITEKLKVATFNCEFLWDGKDPEEGNPAVQFAHRGNPELALEHIKKIAEIIIDIDADIVNLIEVEGIEVLQFLNDSFLHDLDYEIGFVKGIDTYTGQDVALLSKFPIKSIFRYPEKGKSGSVEKSVSKNYIAEIQVGEMSIAVIGLHLLSRPYDVSRIDSRQAQGDAIHNIAMQLVSKGGSNIIVMGDFNDYDGDSMCIDINNNIPITNVLTKIKEMDTEDPQDNLTNVLEYIPKNNRYTSHWDKDEGGDVDDNEKSAIDHILISPLLNEKIVNARVYHLFNPLEVSDHFPVVVEFDFSSIVN